MRRNSNLTLAVSFFAIGAVLSFLATIQVVQDRADDQQALRIGAGVLDGSGSDGEIPVDPESGEVLIDPESGEILDGGGSGDTLAAGQAGSGGQPGSEGQPGSGDQAGTEESGGGTSGSGVDVGGGSGSAGAGSGGSGDIACAPGRNGGNTDTGVSATEIKFGATVAEDGIAEFFLGEVRHGMNAVKNRVNRAGGVCGRRLEIVYKDDAWDPADGQRKIENLIEGEKVFALAVSPSSEGVNAASRSQQGTYFRKKGVPVVGADGLNVSQFQDPYIFPVAAATITTVDVMMKDAYDRAQQAGVGFHPAIVFGNTYRFGIEGAFAANEAYKKLTGEERIPGYENPLTTGGGCKERFCGIPAESQYGTQVGAVNSACNEEPRCNFMILLLEPSTAQNWMGTSGVKEPSDLDPLGISAPQPLFTFGFGDNCKDKCSGMRVWTGYNPPIEQYASKPEVAAFVDALKAESGSADEFNQFTMGGYVGMEMLVAALERTGPDLTRQGLVDTLNSMDPIDTGLTTSPLAWRPGNGDVRHANKAAQAFAIESKSNKFTGWSFVQPPITDPWLGQHSGG